MLGPVPARAFDYDTHYLWTYYLALHVGYTPRQAYQIASAAFAVDHDPDTGPMEAEAFDAIRANPTPEIERVWLRLHAFADALYSRLVPVNPLNWLESIARLDVRGSEAAERMRREGPNHGSEEYTVFAGDPNVLLEQRRQNLDALWALALEEDNPGPYLHFLQDTYSHRDFDSRRGHLLASHAPDYLSFNVTRSREMTEKTIEALQRFAASRGFPQRQPDMERIWQVFDALVKANPAVWVLQVPSYFDEAFQALLDDHVQRLDASWQAMYPRISGVGSPNGVEAWRVVVDAVSADRRYNRLPTFPEFWFQRDVPPKWFQYDFDETGHTGHASVNRDRYAVEWPEIVIGEPQMTCTPEPETQDLVRVTLRVPYEVRGAASLDFQHPLPIYNTSIQTDSGAQKPGQLERTNGRYQLERYVLRPRAALNATPPATWLETLAVGPLPYQKAMVEAPLSCGTPPRRPGPVPIACPVSPQFGPGRHVTDAYRGTSLVYIEGRSGLLDMGPLPWYKLQPPSAGAAQDGTYCFAGFCAVACAYSTDPPASVRVRIDAGVPDGSRVVGAAWWAAETVEPRFEEVCREQRLTYGVKNLGQPFTSVVISYTKTHEDITRVTPAFRELVRLREELRAAVLPNTLACPGGSQPAAPPVSPPIKALSLLRPTGTPGVGGVGSGLGGQPLSNVPASASGEPVALAPPPGPTGSVRIVVAGRVVEGTYQQEADARGVPIDTYFYRTPPAAGGQAPGEPQRWSRFVRVPSVRATSTEPVVWWHVHWEYGAQGWTQIQDRNVAPPQGAR